MFLANIAGAILFALVLAKTTTFDSNMTDPFIALGQEATRAGFATTLLRGIFGGWLVATMVWLLPFAESARVWVIIIITYLVGLGGFSHVIAGATETLYLTFIGHISWLQCVGGYIVPALIGNTIGGVSLVAAINHAQVVAGGKGMDA